MNLIGRIDVKKYLGHATPYQAKHMFRLFYPGEKEKSKEFAEKLTATTANISTAQLQSYFMLFKDAPDDALANVHRIHELTEIERPAGALPAAPSE